MTEDQAEQNLIDAQAKWLAARKAFQEASVKSMAAAGSAAEAWTFLTVGLPQQQADERKIAGNVYQVKTQASMEATLAAQAAYGDQNQAKIDYQAAQAAFDQLNVAPIS